MKIKTLHITFHLFLIFLVAHGQDPELKLPVEVKSKFDAEFSTASTISWKTISPSDSYEADFINKGARKKVRYTDKGDVLFLETSLFPGQQPQKVQHAIEKHFSGYDIEQIREVRTNEQVVTEIDLSGRIISKHKVSNI
jgi:hypothetical protein